MFPCTHVQYSKTRVVLVVDKYRGSQGHSAAEVCNLWEARIPRESHQIMLWALTLLAALSYDGGGAPQRSFAIGIPIPVINTYEQS